MVENSKKILDFIGGFNKVFIIPPFQRNYSWKEEQCEELFNDVINAMQKKKNHYVGNIVYFVTENTGASYSENCLIDGQQRITTILILICALRDMMDNTKEQNTINIINKQYLKNEDAVDNQFRVKLKQTAYDNDVYKDIVEGTIDYYNENKLLINYEKFKKLIEDAEYSPRDIFEGLSFLEMVEVKLLINDTNIEDIQLIFEKINSTGKKLTSADLLRNYLLISNDIKEQEKFYNNYWVKIEKCLTEEYITNFVKDYLKMKICENVNDDEVYNRFKGYVEENKLQREEVLKDMLRYAEYYKYLVIEESSDKKIARCISRINYLKSNEFNCLLLYITEYYKCQGEELFKILDIIMCYLVRFRIVGLSRGSGDLRLMVFMILKKIIKNEIKPNFDDIYFELSNSSNFGSHYPTDEEFENALMTNKKPNHTYGRVVLYAIEEKETSDTLVPLDMTTIEHLMPQNLSNWWIRNLGGSEKSHEVYEKYLNCIGNLALLSQSYNSKISNNPWDRKVEKMKGGGSFKTTREAFKKDSWKEGQIKNRNKNIAHRACEAIAPPLERTRQYNSEYNVLEPGLYDINDIVNATYSKIKSIIIDGDVISIDTWRHLLISVAEYCNNIDSDKFKNLANNQRLYNFISINKNDLTSPKKVSKADVFVESNVSANRAIENSKKLLAEYGLDEKTQITLLSDDE